MKMRFFVVGLLTLATLAFGQNVKSKKEAEAVMAVQNAQTPDQRIAAAEDLVRKFRDTEFKAVVLLIAAQSAQQKGDVVGAMTYAQRTLDADPKNFSAMNVIASQLAQSTREFDLDKDEKLGRATKMATNSIAAINASAKPNQQLTEEQWNAIKKDSLSEAHTALGTIAMLNKKWDTAITEFKTAMDVAATPDPSIDLRLGSAYIDAGRFDEGVASLNKVSGAAGTNEQIKKIAQTEIARAEKLKAAKK